jgi:hypothetical protein
MSCAKDYVALAQSRPCKANKFVDDLALIDCKKVLFDDI